MARLMSINCYRSEIRIKRTTEMMSKFDRTRVTEASNASLIIGDYDEPLCGNDKEANNEILRNSTKNMDLCEMAVQFRSVTNLEHQACQNAMHQTDQT